MHSGLDTWLEEAGFGQISSEEPVSGGCISQACRLRFPDGRTLFLKQHAEAPPNLFHGEAAGLLALAERTSLRIPTVLTYESNFILLEDLGSGLPGSNYWTDFAAGLTELHQTTESGFGFTSDNFCGATPQANVFTQDGYQFFAEQRLLALSRQCYDRGLLPESTARLIEAIAEHLDQWIPEMPPVLIHGDLWSGNLHCCSDGRPALIDPAAYWGWAEAELAMTRLFGGFPESFYREYAACSSLASDWEERIPLYNLYHLLNHLLLFGVSYLQSVEAIATRFGSSVR